jgi:EAL domain-containing protein (putative c-di-GMP-specific phosphodiesterase class I)
MIEELKVAKKHGQFEMYFQPQFSLIENKIVGAESLIRWVHPQKGLVGPQTFIPLAEQSQLIVDIGEWVILDVFEKINQLTKMEQLGNGNIPPISFNLSAKQLHDKNCISLISELIHSISDVRDFIHIEVTETCIMKNFGTAISALHQFRELGAKVSIDDFGTGYSSLNYLRRLPLDILKIDRSFIMDIGRCSEGEIILSTIIDMAGKLGLDVIAEGVETKQQASFLIDKGCEVAQGFLFSEPIPFSKYQHSLCA